MNEKLAFIFPGQGAQSVGMLADLAAEFSLVEETYAEASHELGYNLWHLVAKGPEEKLNQTEYTQPALLAAEIAMWRIWQNKKKSTPLFLAGHSLGEYSALVCAEAINFIDAVKLVAIRGKLMQQAVSAGQGAMVAIAGLDDEKVAQICKEASQDQILAPANYNSIGQTVLSGDYDAAVRAVDLAKQEGAKIAKLLNVSVPSHCELMRSAAEKLAQYLGEIDIKNPVLPVIKNVDVTVYNNAGEIREGLVKQLYKPVRWVEIIKFMYSKDVNCLVECGPGKVLAGLNKRIVPDLPTIKFIELLRR
jgi:[acyl-carrier-protein] S-malonyltransferase